MRWSTVSEEADGEVYQSLRNGRQFRPWRIIFRVCSLPHSNFLVTELRTTDLIPSSWVGSRHHNPFSSHSWFSKSMLSRPKQISHGFLRGQRHTHCYWTWKKPVSLRLMFCILLAWGKSTRKKKKKNYQRAKGIAKKWSQWLDQTLMKWLWVLFSLFKQDTRMTFHWNHLTLVLLVWPDRGWKRILQ